MNTVKNQPLKSVCRDAAESLLKQGISKIIRWKYKASVESQVGTLKIPMLEHPVTISRNNMGIPFINATNREDLFRAMGYAHASDRLSQMIGLKMLSQGRLSEMAGSSMLDLDIYIRTVGLMRISQKAFANLNDGNKELLKHYSQGVNAYINRHQHNLPPGIAFSKYKPEPWKPLDSISIFQLLNLTLSLNVHEEISSLSIAQTIGPEKTAWLLPVYPDEGIALEEAGKMDDIDLKKTQKTIKAFDHVKRLLGVFGLTGVAASNNWAVAKDKTNNGASIFANDTHLMLGMPSIWNILHVKCDAYEAAGFSIAGIPAIIAGYNGHIAWGVTMVMADNQDIFLEKLKSKDEKPHYLFKNKWLPVQNRTETFHIRGKKPLEVCIWETHHGPLLNKSLSKNPINDLQPLRANLPYGIAFSWAADSPDDNSLGALLSLTAQKTVDDALPVVRQIRAIALNMVIADKNNIAWQVTGNYPIRLKGRGLMPSPGWTGEYEWEGFVAPDQLPWALNPAQGFIGTANNRTVPKDYPHTLTSSWIWPERAERIAQLLSTTDRHSFQTSADMQVDTYSLMVPKLKKEILSGRLFEEISQAISSWKNEDLRKKALSAIKMFLQFDGNMHVNSPEACIVGALLHCVTRNLFLDELGPENSHSWQAFLAINKMRYNATCDHLLVRGDESPFWNKNKNASKESKAQIIARSFKDAYHLLEIKFGNDHRRWRWGDLHTYLFETDAAKMAKNMGRKEQLAMNILWFYFNRGPHPAPGDHTTLNVSAYQMGHDFKTWLVPTMRMIVDFSLSDPLYVMNSTGQSDNPSSAHYDDAIPLWIKGNYTSLPFDKKAKKKTYTNVLKLTP